MSFRITLLDARQRPYDPPLDLELLVDGAPVARARTDAAGRAEFAADVAGARHLAVRLAPGDPPRRGA